MHTDATDIQEEGEQALVGSAYRGDRAREYFDWQSDKGTAVSAEIDGFKYAPYVRTGDTVVDFGCGAGHMLARVNAARRIGIEPNPYAREQAAAQGLEMAASPKEVEAGVADVVLSHHALEHALSPWAELRELRRLLQPNGRLVLWLPLDDWRRSRQRRATGPDENHHLYTWTPRSIWNLLAEAGYDVVEVRVVAHAWPPAWALLWRVLPERAFHAVARAWSVLRRERQVLAIATPAGDG